MDKKTKFIADQFKLAEERDFYLTCYEIDKCIFGKKESLEKLKLNLDLVREGDLDE
jgi:hypothetical protein